MQNIIDFILGALPWVAIALTLVIIGIKHKRIREDNNKSASEKDADENYLSSGMVMGMGVGAAVGASLQKSIGSNGVAIGITVGMLVGTIIGIRIKKYER